ncbi:MAG: hypothetical protein J5606_08615 [Bacteroidales bacterium]|nr:hypothetical protein [Bacteroidales bacterium]
MNILQKRNIDKHLSAWKMRKRDEIIDIPQLQTAKNICIFASCQNYKQWKNLSNEISEWQKTANCTFQVFCYINQHLKRDFSQANEHLFHKKHVSFWGAIDKEAKEILQNKSYDILLLFNISDNRLLYYFQSFVNAQFRIGNNNDFIDYTDFVITVNTENTFSTFMQQTEKYLSLLMSNK